MGYAAGIGVWRAGVVAALRQVAVLVDLVREGRG